MNHLHVQPVSTVQFIDKAGNVTKSFQAKVSVQHERNDMGPDSIFVNIVKLEDQLSTEVFSKKESVKTVTCTIASSFSCVTEGKDYEVLYESDAYYYIVDDVGMYRDYPKSRFKDKEDVTVNPYAIQEDARTYHYPTKHGMQEITIENVRELRVSDTGHHYLTTAEGAREIMPPGWIRISIAADKWSLAPGIRNG